MRTLLAFIIIGLFSTLAHAQWSAPVERVYALPYDSVWKAAKSVVVDSGYRVVVDKKQAGILETDVKMMVEKDSILEVMNQYGEVPFIASAEWKWGQSTIKCIVKQVDTVVNLKIIAQLRAFDNHTTSKWEYFPSNGIIENAYFDEIERRLGR
jgi:hypothetical protein